jgi:hypothetical protein
MGWLCVQIVDQFHCIRFRRIFHGVTRRLQGARAGPGEGPESTRLSHSHLAVKSTAVDPKQSLDGAKCPFPAVRCGIGAGPRPLSRLSLGIRGTLDENSVAPSYSALFPMADSLMGGGYQFVGNEGAAELVCGRIK